MVDFVWLFGEVSVWCDLEVCFGNMNDRCEYVVVMEWSLLIVCCEWDDWELFCLYIFVLVGKLDYIWM